MADGHLSTYAELADVLDNLPMLCRENRRRRGLSLRAAATEIGSSLSTVLRFEESGACNLKHAVAIMRWLDEGADR